MLDHTLDLFEKGFFDVDCYIDQSTIQNILAELADFSKDKPGNWGAAGLRNADEHLASVEQLLDLDALINILAPHLSPDTRMLRAVVFTKSLENNWSVPWHQNKIVAVEGIPEAEHWRQQTEIDGVKHAEPPESFLDQMIKCTNSTGSGV